MIKHIFNSCLFLVLVSLLASCGGDSDDVTGSYKIYSYGTTSCDDPEFNQSFEVDDDGCSNISGVEVCISGNVTLNADNTFVINATLSSTGFSEDLSGSGQYTASGNTITICDDGECIDGRVDGDEVTISIPAEDGCILTIKGRK